MNLRRVQGSLRYRGEMTACLQCGSAEDYNRSEGIVSR